MNAVEATNITKKFGSLEVLKGISLLAEEGKAFALIGPNGAGKSTLVKILTTLLSPSSGEVKIMGYHLRERKKIRRQIGVVSESTVFYEQLTAMENLLFFAGLYHLPHIFAKYKAEELLKLVDMWKWRNVQVKKFSTGMRQRINIVRALMHSPKILFLDEPTLALDPQTSEIVRETVKNAKSRGITVFFTTHVMENVEKLADKVAVMKDGRIITCGTLEKIVNDFDGNKKKVEIFFHSPEKATKAYEIITMKFDEVENIRIEKEKAKIVFFLKNGRIGEILKVLSLNDVLLKDVKIRTSTLEEIFIALTSKKSAP